MPRSPVVFLLLSACLLGSLSARGQLPRGSPRPAFGSQKQRFGVGGRVLNAENMQEIGNATVSLEGGETVRVTATDWSGRFVFVGVPAGSYTLLVQAVGFQAARVEVSVTSMDRSNTRVLLRAAQPSSPGNSEPQVDLRQLQVPNAARKSFRKGRVELHDKNNPKGSVKHFRKAIKLHAEYDDAYVKLGLAYLLLDRPDEAQKALEQAIQVYERNPQAHALLGRVLLARGQSEEGIRELAEAVRLDERDWNTRVQLGRALLQMGRVEEAYQHARRAHQLNRSSANTHLLYYNALIRRGEYGAAVAELDEFVTLYPDTPAARQMRKLRSELDKAADAKPN